MAKQITINKHKVCSCCKKVKMVFLFSKDRRDKTGTYVQCKECVKEYTELNKKNILNQKKQYYIKNRDVIREKQCKYRIKNREKINKQKIEHYHRNKKEIDKKRRAWEKNKLKTDPYFKFVFNLRNRLRIAIKNKYKGGSAVRDIGCSGRYAYKYIESMFTDGMTWDNYGKWHIDHIKPLSSFNLESRKQLLTAVHYTNLQPLWAADNIKKNDKTDSY